LNNGARLDSAGTPGLPTRHAASVAYLSPLLKGVDAIVVPSIFRIDVASALARSGFSAVTP